MLDGPLLTLDLTQRSIPPRSKLYFLKPLGVGTPYVESLIGYFARLAEAHHTRVGTLKDLLPGCERYSCHANLAYINGSLVTAAKCREAIEFLTGQQDLGCLTMLRWAKILPRKGLFRKALAWCPKCFECDDTPYWRLSWALEAVEVCPLHCCILQKMCPHCHMQLPRVSGGMRPGFCSLCGLWLGNITYELEAALPVDGEAEIATANLAGRLLATTSDVAPLELPVKKALQEAYLLNKSPDGVPMHNVLQIQAQLYCMWRSRNCNPPLSSVLDLCRRLEVCPVELLTTGSFGCMEGWQTTRYIPADTERHHRRKRRFMDVRKVKRQLSSFASSVVIPPLTLAEVAHKMGFHPNVLWRRFPDLCQRVVQRSKAHQKLCTEQKLAAVAEEIKAIVKKMHETGIQMTCRHVASRMKHPAFLRDARLMEVLKTAFAERR